MRTMKKPACEIRQHILDVARTLMTTKGYTAVGLAELVASAGVPKGSFYYYFKSKEDFGQALLEEYFREYLATIDRLLSATGTGRDRLLGYFRYWSDTQGTDLPEGKCLVVKLGPEVCDLSEGMRQVLQTGTVAIIDRIAAAIEAGQGDKSIVTDMAPRTLAESLYQLWLGASLLGKLHKTDDAFASAMSMTVRLI
ncbi:transcriptional regulator, TetR family [Serratia odorifera DSM 4582]|jgi:TetR/AcrR family transcriptional regulator, transcriptional repressor for nem operon|uniref:Transcriptional regulator, TetR family n=2 Tax=Serratia odorifera TaxID=618 RepID=D4E4D0_SEROD|nr:transcriptional regulator, TetR family [Serratia odorifera DSM 4582]